MSCGNIVEKIAKCSSLNVSKSDKTLKFFYLDFNQFYQSNEIGLLLFLKETGASLANYPRIQAWLNRCKKTFTNYDEANGKGARMFGEWVLSHATKGF